MPRKCRHCKSELPPVKKCTDPFQAKGFCNVDHMAAHGIEKARQQKERKAKQEKKQARKDRREFDRRDIQWQHKQCKQVFNRMRVLEELLWFHERDLRPRCISCGKEGDFCCGHFKTVGAQSNLRYDRMNTYLQCNTYCNKSLSGNIEGNKYTHGYKRGLALRFGDERAKEIIDYCESNTAPLKWGWQKMERWRKDWRAKIREIEAKLPDS